MMTKRVIKFEKQNCSPCEQVSKWLNERGIKYETINPYDTPKSAVKYRVRSVPTVLVYDGAEEVGRVVGFKPDELVKLLGKGNAT